MAGKLAPRTTLRSNVSVCAKAAGVAVAIGRAPLAGLCLAMLLVFVTSGCVSKSKANAQARAAYIAGQQQAMARMQQAQGGPSVTVNGEVRNHVVPWTQGMTLAHALITAEYLGTTDPGQIIIVHQGIATRFDPGKLLDGANILLQPGDIVQLMPRTEPPNP
jgi:hypothetical protein